MVRIQECTHLPARPNPQTVYRLLPNSPLESYYHERTDRNIGWITPEEQRFLRTATVSIAGCGGMGGQLAEKFLRLGIGKIRMADNETFDTSNINRQFAASRGSRGKSKAFETAKLLRAISDDSELVVYPQGINADTVDDFVSGSSVICDEIEFWAVWARILLHQRSRLAQVPVFNCNTIGFGTRLFLFAWDSQTIEERLGLTLQTAKVMQESLRPEASDQRQIRLRLMEAMIRGLIPELPEYCSLNSPRSTVQAFRTRLSAECKAPIIATNPPLATGFLADRVLLYLLRAFPPRLGVRPTPPTPGYLYFDAATMEAKVVGEGVSHDA
jgi:molybdopterin/thiamine biosynthesis adenylyltransferase